MTVFFRYQAMKVAHKARDIFASQKLLIGFLGSATSFFLGVPKKGVGKWWSAPKWVQYRISFFLQGPKKGSFFFFFRKDFREVGEEQTTICMRVFLQKHVHTHI